MPATAAPPPPAPLPVSWRNLLAVAALAAGIAGPSLPAQTTFLGTWEVFSNDWVLGPPYVVNTDPNLDPPGTHGDFVYRPYFVYEPVPGQPLLRRAVQQWEVSPIIQRGATSTTHVDNRWGTASAWSSGVPDLTADVRIVDSHSDGTVARNGGAIQLPGLNQDAATARSLTVFGEGPQSVVLTGGTLNLTPLALGESLRVGIASANPADQRKTILSLDNATLTSTGIATIGSGVPAGAGGWLTGRMNLEGGSSWLHPAGLIELGGHQSSGVLVVRAGALLAGSLLPGVATDPRVTVAPESSLHIDAGGAARLSELTVNSRNDPLFHYLGISVAGTLDTGKLELGTTQLAEATFGNGSTSRLGEVTIGHGSKFYADSATVEAATVVVSSGDIEVRDNDANGGPAQVVIGTAGTDGQVPVFTLAAGSGDSATLVIDHASDLVVHGAAYLGRFGTGTITVRGGGTLDLRGKAVLGYSDSESAGSGSVEVRDAGSALRAQSLEAGYSYFDDYAYNPYPSPSGSLVVVDGGKLEVTGLAGTRNFGGTDYDLLYPGYLNVGKHGTLTIGGSGAQVRYSDPVAGATVIGRAQLANSGTITGGESIGTLPAVAHIDFGATGGELVNRGTLAPGPGAGWLAVNGDLSLNSASRLVLEIGGPDRGTGYDTLSITGALRTDGTLAVTFINGFTPGATATFQLFDFGSLSGSFATLELPAGYAWNTGLLQTTGVLTAGAVPEPATAALLAGLGALGTAAARRRKSRRPADAA